MKKELGNHGGEAYKLSICDSSKLASSRTYDPTIERPIQGVRSFKL